MFVKTCGKANRVGKHFTKNFRLLFRNMYSTLRQINKIDQGTIRNTPWTENYNIFHVIFSAQGIPLEMNFYNEFWEVKIISSMKEHLFGHLSVVSSDFGTACDVIKNDLDNITGWKIRFAFTFAPGAKMQMPWTQHICYSADVQMFQAMSVKRSSLTNASIFHNNWWNFAFQS